MDCADEQKVKKFMGTHKVVMYQALHYVDHDDIEAKEGHVKTTVEDISIDDLSIKSSPVVQLSMVES